jgi:hypothetical protein
MLRTLGWLHAEFGGAEQYMIEQGLEADVISTLRESLLLSQT